MIQMSVVRHGALAAIGAVLLSCSLIEGAVAAGAIEFKDWDGGVGNAPFIGAGASLGVTQSLSKSSYSDNPNLAYSAWAHAGGSPWYTFNLTSAADTTIRLATTDPNAAFKPGITVWASGSTRFDGGQEGIAAEISSVGWGTPHSFNAVGQVGDYGTYWLSGDGVTTYSNMKETLAYGVTGPAHAPGTTGWGESIQTGIHDISVDDLYEFGITGSSGDNWLELSFSKLQPGWYVIFVGGTDNSLTAQQTLLSVSTAAVPEPETWTLLAAGLSLLGQARSRRSRC